MTIISWTKLKDCPLLHYTLAHDCQTFHKSFHKFPVPLKKSIDPVDHNRAWTPQFSPWGWDTPHLCWPKTRFVSSPTTLLQSDYRSYKKSKIVSMPMASTKISIVFNICSCKSSLSLKGHLLSPVWRHRNQWEMLKQSLQSMIHWPMYCCQKYPGEIFYFVYSWHLEQTGDCEKVKHDTFQHGGSSNTDL